ncbi:MAG TPA: insulinase family protein, partial [Thermopetrobacter sp.]|nr:insulinase family protein [Thermopetrobacter sp.]
EVVVVPDHRAPVVTHMVWFRVGAADEPSGKTGLAHFFEHLMFKGTEKVAPGAYSRIIERHGGNDNAFTGQDYTAYFARIAREHLPLVMEMEADRMRNLKLDARLVKTELEVIKEERRMRTDNNPRALFSERFDAALFTAHPYRRPVVGWMDDVRRLTLKDAVAFYRRHYSPRNAIVVVVGDVEPEEVFRLAKRYFGPLANDGPPGARVRTSEPPPLAARRIVMKDPRIRAPLFQRGYVAPSYRTAKGDAAHALEVLAQALGGGTTSLLYRRLVVEEKVATWAGAWYDGDPRDYGTFGIYASPRPGVSMEKLEARIEALLAEVREKGVAAAELKRAARNLAAETTYALDSQFALARIVGSTLATDMDLKVVEEWEERILAVTPGDVRRAMAAVLRPENSVTGILLRGAAPVVAAAKGVPAGGKKGGAPEGGGAAAAAGKGGDE